MATRKPVVLVPGGLQEIAAADTLGFATLSVSTSFTLGTNTSPGITQFVNGAANTVRTIAFQTAGLKRWEFGMGANAETGGSIGSDFYLSGFDDSGNVLGNAFYCRRSDGVITLYAVSIQGGNINSTVIGNASPSTGAFTLLTASTPAVGDNSTNVATTAFVANAVNGMATFSTTGGTTTLTQAQYSAAVLIVTGALTSNAVLVVPNSTIMTVLNNTSGAFTLTVKTAAGSGTTILQGTSRELVANGTNVISADSDISGDTFSTLTGTTSLTVPLVRTTASALNLSSAKGTQLAVTDDGFIQILLNGGQPAAAGQYNRLQFDTSNYWQNNYGGEMQMQSFNGVRFGTQGGTILDLPLGANPAVNYTQIDNAATGTSPAISARGTDTNVGLTLAGKGTGVVNSSSDFSMAGYNYRSGAAALTAAGTTQATATAITKTNSVFTTVASGAGARLPSLPPVNGAFAEFCVVNAGANALLLYPASGLAINGTAANTALSVAAGSIVRGIQISTTAYRFS